MKQNLQRTSEWIELFFKLCSGFWHRNCTQCTDRGSCAGGGVAGCSPCTLSVFICSVKSWKHFWVFFLLHPAVVVFATLMVKSWPVGAVAIAVLGVFYGLHSIRLRVHQVIQEQEFLLPAAAVVVIAAFLVCSYKQSQTDCMRLFWGAFFCMAARNTDQALCGQLSFLCKNKRGQCRCDSRKKYFPDGNYCCGTVFRSLCRPADGVLYDTLLWIS